MQEAGPLVVSLASLNLLMPSALRLFLNLPDIGEAVERLSRGVPAGIERQRVLIKHALKEADHAARAFHDQPALVGIACKDFKTEFFVKCARKRKVLDREADREISEIHISNPF